MAVRRLSKVAREFNVGLSTIVELLHNKGSKISSDPNAKLTDEEYAIVANAFSTDSKVKKESSVINLKETRKKKSTVHLDEAGNVATEEDGEKAAKDDFISVKDEVKLTSHIKIVDRIDLNPERKHPEPAAPAPKPKQETKKAEPKPAPKPEAKPEPKPEVKPQPEPKPEPKKPEAPKPEPVVEKTPEPKPAPKPEPAPEKKEEKAPETPAPEVQKPAEPVPFKRPQPPLKEVKVVGTIDLDAINQRTRPPKKSKQDRERDRKEQKKNNRDAKNKFANKQDNTNFNAAELGDEDMDTRKKRKRIHRQDEKVQIDNVSGGGSGKSSRMEESKRKLKKLKKKKVERAEISEEDVERQIKDTFARLGNKGKSQSSKHRREKRDAVHQKMQAELEQEEMEKKILKLTEFVTVAELATMMNVSPTEVISACMALGLFVSINQRLDAETINIVADEFGYSVEFVSVEIQEAIEDDEEDNDENMEPRPPIVTVMGHVDHGKTSLLDSIRKTNVIAGEAGGITQHIGAYNVKLPDGRAITFLDTPGHEAFTAMRARGAQVTDIAIIIIAADDAINKIDKPGANPDKIREELANMNYLVEEWGGKYQCQEIAAKKGLNIEELLEKVLLEAELLELKANPHKKATGSIIESSLDKGRGYVATVLVQSGTLKVGDVMLAGQYYGHVKAMFNERGEKLTQAGPSEPALILGLNGAPQAGDKFNVMSNEKDARQLANKREQLQREQGLRTQKHITLDEIGRRIAIGNFQELNVIVKGDVDGSIEALSDSLIKLSTDEIQVNIIHKAVGQITEGDVLLAAASNAIIVGFQVRPSMGARKLAEKEQIDIRLYSIIYQAIEELKAAMEGMLSPDIKEEVIATVEVLETFKISKVGTIAGCIVREGKITRTAKVRVIRDGIVIYTGALGSLKRFKDDVKEVAKGFECGLNIENYNDVRVGDIIEAYQEVEVKKTL